ncbi:MAG: hypothetical protein BalsKO_13820 [Balneolaceae bacterium]
MVIGDNSKESSADFSEIKVQDNFNFETNRNVELVLPEGHSSHNAKVYQYNDSDTTFLGIHFIDSNTLELDISANSIGVFTVPTGISGNGDYSFNFIGSDTHSKSKALLNENYYTLGTWNSSGVFLTIY